MTPSDSSPAAADSPRARFQIFRAKDAINVDAELMPLVGMTGDDMAGIGAAIAAGYGDGATTRLLMADEATGMSLTYTRFKAGFLLLRHSHDADCAYYVISGEAHLGNAVLKAGDSFLVPKGDFYSYQAGPKGVEIIEFRTATHFHLRFGGNDPPFWSQILAATKANAAQWRDAPRTDAEARLMGERD